MTNKTPITDVKEYLFNTFNVYSDPQWLEQTIVFLNSMEEKEKQFAFDCFEAGREYENDSIFTGGSPLADNFEEFYQQYVL